MRINRGKTKEHRPRIQDLRPGQVFEWEGQLYMRCNDDDSMHPCGCTLAVSLGDGKIITVEGSERVTPDNGEYVPS